MKNNKKFNRTFQLSLVATALSLANLGWATDLTCNTTTGCKYIQGPGNTWYINDTATQLADAVNVTVEAGNYQNKAKTETGASTSLGRPSQSSDALFHIFDLTKQDNVITLKSGVKATLKEDYTSSQLVHVNGATANLEQGVKLIVDKNYSQIHNIPDANGNFDGNAAIESRNSTINTQADIELNNDGSNAIESQETSIINSSNHKITMNGENNGAYTLFGKDIVNIENVTITGNKDLQSVFDIGNDRTEEQIVNAKKLNATLNDKSIFMNLHDSGTQTVTLRDSKIKAGYGLHAVPLGDEHTVTLNLHNSELNTTRALVSINDPNFPVDEEDEEEIDANAASTFHLHLIADNNSKLSGAIIENPQRPAKTEVNVTLANSQWNFNQSSILHHLNTQNSTVKFEPTSEYKTLTIKGDLTGSTTFDLNTNIAENKTDKIVVKGKAEGDHHLNVTDHGTHVANGKVTLVETNTGNAKFHLANANGYVALGAYKYFLTPEGKNWVLAHSQSAVTPQPQPQ
ncbi:pertactin-like passenger domain-containing protein, partial [Aggregatibacter segnis]